MAFQSTVSIIQGFGVPGELFTDAPYIVKPYTLVSASAAYNIIGATACTVTSQGVAEAGSGGDFGFAGIIVDPKDQALFGVGAAPLSPTLVLPNNSQVALCTMGNIVVTLPAAANIGDYVVYDNTTGALETIAPTDPLPVGTTFANAIVTDFTVGGIGLGVITINPTYVIPQLA
jgi:hypothetical protein